MSDWKIGGGTGSGSGTFDKAEHEDHLLFAIGVELLPDQTTRFGTADAAACAYFGCIDDSTVLADYLLFGTALVPIFVSDAEAGFEVACGRLVKGQAKGGQNPPWLLETPTSEDLAAVGEWLDKHATRLRSGKIVIELDTLESGISGTSGTSADDDEPF